MFLPLPTEAKPAGMPVPKARAPSLIAEVLRALAERNRAMGLGVGQKRGSVLVPIAGTVAESMSHAVR